MQRAAGYFIIKINLWFKKLIRCSAFLTRKQSRNKSAAAKYAEIPRDQHLVFLTSKQSKPKTSCDSKMADKTVVQERENQCKAEIKETSSAQCPVSLKGRRPHALRGPTVPLQNNSENVSSQPLTRPIMCCKQPRVEWTTKPKIPEFFEGYTFRASVYTVWVLPTMVHSYSAW